MKAGEYIREELTPDGLHPNDKGHKLVAEEIEKFLESVKAELEVEEKEPVFPKAMTENAYENAKRLTIREISPKLCGFHADTEEKTGHLDHFKNGWIGKKPGILVSNHQFNWWFIISPPKGYCYYSPQRAVSQALLLARYKAVLLESSESMKLFL